MDVKFESDLGCVSKSMKPDLKTGSHASVFTRGPQPLGHDLFGTGPHELNCMCICVCASPLLMWPSSPLPPSHAVMQSCRKAWGPLVYTFRNPLVFLLGEKNHFIPAPDHNFSAVSRNKSSKPKVSLDTAFEMQYLHAILHYF